jgi:hypothetical protein
MTILKRPPGDAFSFRLFYQLINKIKRAKNYFYVWSAVLSPNYRYFYHKGVELIEETETYYSSAIANGITEDLVVLGIKDHLSVDDFNPWTQEQPTTVEYLSLMFDWYKDKHFIVLTSVENLEYYINKPNVDIIPWGGDIVNHQAEYKTLEPVLDKNFDSTYTFISLNRNYRAHRVLLLPLLYGLGLGDNGLVSCMFKNNLGHPRDIIDWQFSSEQRHIQDLVDTGYTKFMSTDLLLKDSPEIYVNGNNDNVSNFKNKLKAYYQNTFVEIVSETSFTERAYLLTEKTLNSIYGCNFPIILCGCGAVAQLRAMGFDMFDDVIDHSYDLMENPIDRLYHAIADNIEILTDNEIAKKLWVEHRQRFVNNVAVARTDMYKFYSTRATEKFQQVIDTNKY